MDRKTLNALCVQLAFLELQFQALSLLFQVQHPTIDVKGEIKRIVMEGADLVGLEMTQKIRDSIQNGVVLQDMKNMGLGDLWSPRESPDGPEEPQ
jgi:hypothetical protein